MAEEQVVENVEDALAGEAADFLFGKEPEDDYEPDPKPVVEGEESEVEETDESEDDEVEAKADDEPEYVEIEHDGKLYEVPTELKDAFLKSADYTQKTQEVSQQRKQVEVQIGEIQQRAAQFEFAESVQPDVLKAQQLEATAEQYHQYMRDNIDQLSSTDIEKIRITIEDTRRQRDELVNSIQQKTTEFQQAQQQSREELLNKGTEVLKQKIPGWGETQQKQVHDYALSLGFTEAEIGQVVDPRQVEALWKAQQYDALKSGAKPAVKKVQGAPSIRPKARDPKTGKFAKQEKLKKQLKSTKLTQADKANLIGEDIASKFF